MAAGLGFKTFTTGEVLQALDVNGYLMQGILVFATEAARNSAITSPQEGQFAFTKDTNSTWYYDGAAWVASGASGDVTGVTAGTGILVASPTGPVPTVSIDTAVTADLTTAQTMTNKTLTTPVIASISNGGTVTVPSGADTLVARTSTDTMTNKTLTAPKINLAFNAQTGTTYTLVAADSGKLVTSSNASSVVITIPASVFAAGEQINVQSIGVGLTTISGGGVTITSTGATSAAPILRVRYSAATIICTASNVFTVIGDLS
jgi:hypothetical protein